WPYGRMGVDVRAVHRLRGESSLLRRRDLDGVLRPDVQGALRQGGQDQASDQRAGDGPAAVPDRGVPDVLPIAGRAAHRAADRRHPGNGRGHAGGGRGLPPGAGHLLPGGPGPGPRGRRRARGTADERDSRGRRRGRLPAADLQQAAAGPPDLLPGGDRAARLPGVWGRQLQGAVRVHRAGAGDEGESLMEAVWSKGTVARQAHVGVPDGTYEEEHGRETFFGRSSHLYRLHPPTAWVGIEGPLRPRALDINQMKPEDLVDPVGGWV